MRNSSRSQRKTIVKRGQKRRRFTVRTAITITGWILTAVLLYLLLCMFLCCGPVPVR